jgi:hypothetical protein
MKRDVSVPLHVYRLMSDLSTFDAVFVRPMPESPRMLVYTSFDGPIPPIIGYWVMN